MRRALAPTATPMVLLVGGLWLSVIVYGLQSSTVGSQL